MKVNEENPLGSEKISRLLHDFALPSIIAMLVGALYNIVDQFFIGRSVGMYGNAATNVALPLTTVCTALGLLFGVGGASKFKTLQEAKPSGGIGGTLRIAIFRTSFLRLSIRNLSLADKTGSRDEFSSNFRTSSHSDAVADANAAELCITVLSDSADSSSLLPTYVGLMDSTTAAALIS